MNQRDPARWQCFGSSSHDRAAPLLNVFSHVVLILGVLVVAFPLYLTFVASTQTSEAIVQTPMPMLPGSHLIENYTAAWNGTAVPAPRHRSDA